MYKSGMGRRGLRLLVLAVSLPLVLPPGWCCWLLLSARPQVTYARSTKAPPAKSAGLCCCQAPAPPPERPCEDTRSKERRTPPAKHCPCTDRQTTPPSYPPVEQDDGGFTFVAVLPLSDAPPPVFSVELLSPAGRPPTRPLHVLNCVWRC